MVIPGILFEELGFTYLGPIDGHNLTDLLECLNQAAHTEGPVLLHVITKKGKGYAPAEADSCTWHGTGQYKIESGELMKKPGPPSYPKVFADTVIKIADKIPESRCDYASYAGRLRLNQICGYVSTSFF